jgi:RNA polymerase sigma-70 factor (ECF subfamily)
MPDNDARVAAARGGDERAFRALVDDRRREVVVHCYRILGSWHDAEDAVQEALLRAWKALPGFDGRASFRNWLYKIATNVCLTRLEARPARTLGRTEPPSDPRAPLPEPLDDSHWIEPAPDAALAPGVGPADPEARYTARETVSLAFLAALQLLPPKQRAVLILRDVMGWEASEVAELLETTVVSANSALQRARESLENRYRPTTEAREPIAEEHRSLLRRYLDAWEQGDAAALVSLLRFDATVTMPPFPTLFVGRENVRIFVETALFVGGAAGRYRMLATTANGLPAAACYRRGADGIHRADGIHTIWVEGNEIARLVAFLDPSLQKAFGLGETI